MSDIVISKTASQYYFERRPPYSEEMIQKAKGEEVKVKYSLKKREEATSKVTETQMIETKTETKDVISKEQLYEIGVNLRKAVPDFDIMSDKQRDLVIADIVNGKYDLFIFE